MRGVQYLYGTIFPDQLDIPSFVINYDIEINGPRYYEPPNEAGAEALWREWNLKTEKLQE